VQIRRAAARATAAPSDLPPSLPPSLLPPLFLPTARSFVNERLLCRRALTSLPLIAASAGLGGGREGEGSEVIKRRAPGCLMCEKSFDIRSPVYRARVRFVPRAAPP